jgi:general stress protein YciG
MAGTKQGAAKAAQTNKDKYGKDFYRQIGAQSWKNPKRSRTTGFALLPKEQVVELGRKGGQQNKGKTYAKKDKEEYVTAEELRQSIVSSDLSE